MRKKHCEKKRFYLLYFLTFVNVQEFSNRSSAKNCSISIDQIASLFSGIVSWFLLTIFRMIERKVVAESEGIVIAVCVSKMLIRTRLFLLMFLLSLNTIFRYIVKIQFQIYLTLG